MSRATSESALTARRRLNTGRVWRAPPVQGFMAAYALGGLPLGFILYDAPLHLSRGLGCSQAFIGRVLWIPPLGWEVGYFFWGWVVDRLASASATEPQLGRNTRLLFALLAVLALPLAFGASTRSRVVTLALLFFGTFVASGFVIASLADVTRRHSKDYAATLAGLGAGSWSGLVTIAMPIFGRLVDRSAFGAAYAIAAACPLIGCLGWQWRAGAHRAG